MSDFATFHLYVCAALLAKFSEELLRERDFQVSTKINCIFINIDLIMVICINILTSLIFQGLMILLQNLPTHQWGNEEIGEMLANAFRLKYMFADAPRHLTSKAT